ncbi:MAG: DUF2520 domain-containing protein [Myxococcota bacterium]
MLRLLPEAGVDAVGWSRGEPIPSADAYWLAVRDGAIGEVAARLPREAVALHASGALGPEALGDRPERGVLHPLMTFPGPGVGVPALAGVGARVAGTPGAVAVARRVAGALGMRAFEVPGDTRRYHAAASLASGHLGALFLRAADTLAGAGVPEAEARALLLPLALESLRRAAAGGPDALTGPAARDDRATEDAHRAVLADDDRPLYEGLARAIREMRSRTRQGQPP